MQAGADFQVLDCQDRTDVAVALQDTDIAFVNLVPVDAAALAGMRPDGLIIRYGIGYDNIDVEAARRAGIRVANIPDYGSDTVADHVASLMLALLRRLAAYTAAIKRDGWTSPDVVGRLPALASTTVGLVGVGRIGVLVARRLQAFGIGVLASDFYANRSRMGPLDIGLVHLKHCLLKRMACRSTCRRQPPRVTSSTGAPWRRCALAPCL